MAKRKQNNIVIWVLLGILFLCFVLLGCGFYKYFYAGSGTDEYGDRLEGIEKYPLSKTLEDEISNLYEGNDSIGEIVVNVKGKIIYINIEYNTQMLKNEAQALAIKSLDAIGEKNLTFYDVHFLLTYNSTTSEENNNFPIFGARSAGSNKVVW